MERLVLTVSLALSMAAFGQSPSPCERPCPHRNVKLLSVLAGVITFEMVAARYDRNETEKGLKLGVAYEGNTWLLGTNHPSWAQLFHRDLIEAGLSASPAFLLWFFHKKAAYLSTSMAPVGMGFGHIEGGNQWKTLIAESETKQ